VPVDSASSAIIDWEVGRSGVAAAAFLRTAESHRTDTKAFAGTQARAIAWNLTLAASANLSVGDTSKARELVDSIETIGRRSGNSRDPLLHHYVRAGLLSAAGRTEEAISQ
jgi:hypothetical protein